MDERVNSIKEVISSTLVDIFVNKIYGSITKGSEQELLYHAEISKFNKNVATGEESYLRVLNSIHVRFCTNTKHSTISLDGFVSIMAEMLFPPEYYAKASSSQKYGCLSHLIIGTIADMSYQILTPDNIAKIFKRDVVYCNAFKTITNGIIHARVIAIKNKFLSSENKPLISEVPRYEHTISQLTRQLSEEKEKTKNLLADLKAGDAEIDSLNDQIMKLKENESKYKTMIKLLKSIGSDKQNEPESKIEVIDETSEPVVKPVVKPVASLMASPVASPIIKPTPAMVKPVVIPATVEVKPPISEVIVPIDISSELDDDDSVFDD